MIVREITIQKSREWISPFFSRRLLFFVVEGGLGSFVTMGVDWQYIQAERNNVSIERYLSVGGKRRWLLLLLLYSSSSLYAMSAIIQSGPINLFVQYIGGKMEKTEKKIYKMHSFAARHAPKGKRPAGIFPFYFHIIIIILDFFSRNPYSFILLFVASFFSRLGRTSSWLNE